MSGVGDFRMHRGWMNAVSILLILQLLVQCTRVQAKGKPKNEKVGGGFNDMDFNLDPFEGFDAFKGFDTFDNDMDPSMKDWETGAFDFIPDMNKQIEAMENETLNNPNATVSVVKVHLTNSGDNNVSARGSSGKSSDVKINISRIRGGGKDDDNEPMSDVVIMVSGANGSSYIIPDKHGGKVVERDDLVDKKASSKRSKKKSSAASVEKDESEDSDSSVMSDFPVEDSEVQKPKKKKNQEKYPDDLQESFEKKKRVSGGNMHEKPIPMNPSFRNYNKQGVDLKPRSVYDVTGTDQGVGGTESLTRRPNSKNGGTNADTFKISVLEIFRTFQEHLDHVRNEMETEADLLTKTANFIAEQEKTLKKRLNDLFREAFNVKREQN